MDFLHRSIDSIKKLFWAITLFPKISAQSSPEALLKTIIDWVLSMISSLGLPVVIVGIIESIHFSRPDIALQYGVLFTPIVLVFFLKNYIHHKLRAAILLVSIYTLATLNIISYGFGGAGIPIFFALFLLATLFFGGRGGLLAIVLAQLPLGIVGWHMVRGTMSLNVDLMEISRMPVSWLTASCVLLFLGLIMVASLYIFKKGLLDIAQFSQDQAKILEEGNLHLQELLAEKNALLKEIHHRVKNNLGIIDSLLTLKSISLTSDGDALAAFHESKSQVHSIAMVHERLYQSKNLSKIDMQEYIEALARELLACFADEKNITTVFNLAKLELSVERAVPCGLMLNEIITNICKHAFVDRNSGTVEITLSADEEGLVSLTVKDNGRGFDESKQIKAIGLQIIELQVTQLEGKLSLNDSDGLTVHIEFYSEPGRRVA